MAVAYLARWPKVGDEDPTELSQRVNAQIMTTLGQRPPEGNRFHAEGPTGDGGWWVLDLWESDESFTAFRANVLEPALASVGIDPGSGKIERLDVAWDSTQMGPPAAS